jgi:hypothetical protein
MSSQDDADDATPRHKQDTDTASPPTREDVSEASTVKSAEDASLNDED